MTEPLDLEPIKARLAALAVCDGPVFPKADWQAEMEALVAEVERLRDGLREVVRHAESSFTESDDHGALARAEDAARAALGWLDS